MFGFGKRKPKTITPEDLSENGVEDVARGLRPLVAPGKDPAAGTIIPFDGDSPPILHESLQKTDGYLAATALTRMQADVGSLARRFDEFVTNIGALNGALGDFRDRQVVPIKEELRHLRYNLGAKVEQTVTRIETMSVHLDRQLNALMRLQGKSDAEIENFKTEHGIVQAPSGPELEAQVREWEAMKEENYTLVEQNKRLLARVSALEGQLKRFTEVEVIVPDRDAHGPGPVRTKGKARRGK